MITISHSEYKMMQAQLVKQNQQFVYLFNGTIKRDRV